mmetsp:Transcript_30823/g.100379  ORF Transcript_30823/g.100379 Transcript_30823/m.100379 type:complete len:179 (+) Transcript_30823:3-539(+)
MTALSGKMTPLCTRQRLRRVRRGACSARAETGVSRRTAALSIVGAAAVAAQPTFAAFDFPDYEYKTAASGLQYFDVTVGDGSEAIRGQKIQCNYEGRLLSNGYKFDSSFDRGKPLSFSVGVGQVIKAWDEALLGGEGIPPMKRGSRRAIKVPASLGYGAKGVGPIPPNSDLWFLVDYV